MSWNPNAQEETTLAKLSSHFLDDIEYAIKTINRHENRNVRMGQMICGFWHYNNETFLDIRYDSRLPNQRDEVLSSWDFGLGCYKHRKILIHSPHRTTGYWQRKWSYTYMAMHMEAEKEAYAWEWE